MPRGRPKKTTVSPVITSASSSIGKSDIKAAALSAWSKLSDVVNTELDLIKQGQHELTASTVTACVAFLKASHDLASSSEDLSPKDAEDRRRELYEHIGDLPTFEDEIE